MVQNIDVVYSAVLESIEKKYLEKEVSEVRVLEILSGTEKNYVNLDKNDWVMILERALKYFERADVEEYEKCARCLNIINHLKTT